LSKIAEKADTPPPDHFGARFGRLVRSYREDLGLSAKELARQLWDDEGRASSVAKLEGGQVRNPHADTVKLYAGTLEIPQEQIDALRAPASAPAFPVSDLDKLRRWMDSHARETLEGLALRFGHESPETVAQADLKVFLISKSQDLKRLEAQVETAVQKSTTVAA
jgi:transcriptional regulator with XRE-family HTH domain